MKNRLRISLMIAMAFLALLMISCRKKQEPQVEPGFDEDTHYLISYESNGDGTCYVSEIRTDPSYSQSFILEIPERSPAGDIVTEIRCEPFEIHLPEYLSEKDYEEILTKLEQARDEGKITTSDITCFTSSYKLTSKGPMRYYPIVEVTPVYVGPNFDDIPPYRRAPDVKALWVIMTHADYTLTDLKEDYDYLRDLVEQSDSENKETILESLPNFEENYGSYISEIKLPDTVKAITTESFYASCPFLTSVDLPDSLTMIPQKLFYGMRYLESVSIPNSVTEIEQDAFYKCESLLSVTLPEQLQVIGQAAFAQCFRLESVHIPDTIVRVSSGAFDGCLALKAASFGNGCYLGNSNNPYLVFWKAKDDNVQSITVHQDVKLLATGALSSQKKLKKVILPNGITEIPNSMFSRCSALESIILPDSVIGIGNNAFAYCENLTEIHLPKGLTTIGESAFLYCKKLPEILLPDSVTSIGEEAFCSCLALKSIDLPQKLTKIERRLFSNCSALESVLIPDGSVESIGSYAFSSCDSLKSIVIPDSVKKIESSAFSGAALETLVIPDSVDTIAAHAFNACDLLESIVIPDSVKYIGEYAFANCTSLKQITIPASVVSVPRYAFWQCTSLENVIVSEGVEQIEKNAFLNCESLVSVSFPSSIDQMESNAFDGCAKLISPFVYEDVYYLGNSNAPYLVALRPVSKEIETCTLHQDTKFVINGAFRDCASLTSVTLSPALLTLSDEAFMGCNQLSKVVLGESLTAIGARAFRGCDRLTSLVLPRGLSTLGDDIFYRSSFHVVYYSGSAEEWSKISLGDNPRLKSVKVYFYSETQPDSEGNYWRYVDGIPVAW